MPRLPGTSRFICLLAGLAALSGCAQPPAAPPTLTLTLRPVSYDALSGWATAHLSALLPALLQQCRRLALLPKDEALGGAGLAKQAGGRAGDWAPFCRAIRWVPAGDDDAARKTVAAWLQPYAVGSLRSSVAHFTGYFEPVVAGSLTRDATHMVPVYRRPDDLVSSETDTGHAGIGREVDGGLAPYWTRAQIDHGALSGRALAICWLESQADLFVLQLQGFGRVRLRSGQIIRLGYAGRNGAPTVPIGRLLVDQGQIAPASLSPQSIRAWLLSHPEQATSLIEQNPSYVFFRVVNDLRLDQGPVGALGTALLPLRSIAVDAGFLPLAVPVWVDTEAPATDGRAERVRRLMLAQDLGAGIDGATRADIFFGWGEAAERRAGSMHAAGTMAALLPRPPSRQ